MVRERRALLMLKPDGVRQGLARPVEEWLGRRGFTPSVTALLDLTPDLRSRLYATTRTGGALDWELNAVLYTLGPVLVVLLDGDPGEHPSAAHRLTSLKGDFRPSFARSGTLRADMGALNPIFNLVHTSDDPDELEREVEVVFGDRSREATTEGMGDQPLHGGSPFSPWAAISECLDVLAAATPQPTRTVPSFRATLELPWGSRGPVMTREALSDLREALRLHGTLLPETTADLVAGVSSGRTSWVTWLAAVEAAVDAEGRPPETRRDHWSPPWIPYLAYTTLRYVDLCLGGTS